MADNLGEPAIAAALAKAASFAPGFAGAVLSLAFIETLTSRGRFLAVVVGLAAAMFLAPGFCAILDLFWPGNGIPAEIRSAVLFLTGLCAMGCLPKLLGALQRYAGDPLGLLKFRGAAQ